MNANLETIYTDFHSKLHNFIVGRVSDHDTAEDILQDVYLKIHSKIDGLRESDRLESWIYQITRNAIIDYHRRALKAHYLCFVLNYDPASALETLTVPTLAIYAELDTQVPPDVNIPLIETALKTAGNDDYVIHAFKKSNHWFAQAEIGTTTEMRELIQQSGLDHYDFVPGFLETLGDRIESQALTD